MTERIAVIGLGYVGLPVALAFAERYEDTVGYDIAADRVAALQRGEDSTGEVPCGALQTTRLRVTASAEDLTGASFFVVTVPTPIDGSRRPDLGPLRAACAAIGPFLRPGAAVVFESTVYPGVTEEVCGPLLERHSGLARSDFRLGYSPERINPGDQVHTFAKIVKVVAGEDAETLERVARVYESVVEAGVHRAPSIKVAEAAKVIENTQRDLNIALMNELAIICDRLGIRTAEVLEAARTKWNFLGFTPGLVGGHCIGVDPYYLTALAEAVGYHPEVILAGRRINDSMGRRIAERTVKLIVAAGGEVRGARVGILGLTFKEDVPDLRNSRVPDIVRELRAFGAEPLVHDPLADPGQAMAEYGIALCPAEALSGLSALIVAVPHATYREQAPEDLVAAVKDDGIVVDVKSMLSPAALPKGLTYWSL